MYEKCMIVPHGLGIALGTLSEMRKIFGVSHLNVWLRKEKAL